MRTRRRNGAGDVDCVGKVEKGMERVFRTCLGTAKGLLAPIYQDDTDSGRGRALLRWPWRGDSCGIGAA